jgi:acyl-CoA thioester hydrolase
MTGWKITWQGAVERGWLDELDHVNFLAYQRIAEKGNEALWTAVSDGRSIAERRGAEYVMLETHVRYLSELRLGEAVKVETALLAHDDKRYQLLHRISGGERLACTVETVNLAFDLRTRRAMAFTPEVRAALDAMAANPPDAKGELPLKRKRSSP